MPFGRRTNPPQGDQVVKELYEHLVERGGRLSDFGARQNPTVGTSGQGMDISPEQEAYFALLLRYGEPAANAEISAQVNRRCAVALENYNTRWSDAGHAAAAKGRTISLLPFALVANSIWLGKHWGLLGTALSLTPHDEWNIKFLPPDDASGFALGLPPCPRGEQPQFVHAASTIIAALEPRWEAAYQAARRSGDIPSLANAAREIEGEIKSFAEKTWRFYEQQWRDYCAKQGHLATAR